MEKTLVIQLGNYKIVAEIDDANTPEIPPELCVYLEDNNGCVMQDICLVRPHYEYNHNKFEVETNDDVIDCLVWGEAGDEDYTNKYMIDVYKEEE